MSRHRAFTLIELLVVIAILMAILMPALRVAKHQARKAVCTTHVGQLSLVVRMYADDWDGKTHDSPNQGLWDNAHENPTVVTKYSPNDNLAYWGLAYSTYADNRKVFSCPSAVRVDDWPEWGWRKSYQPYFKYCSYGLNGYIRNKKIDLVFKRPSEIIAFQDHIEQRLDNINSDMFCIGPTVNINLTQWRNGGTQGDFPYAVEECFRHRGASITSWLDGHVTSIEKTTGEDVPCKWYDGQTPL